MNANAFDLAITQAQPGFCRIADRHQLVTWAEESQFARQAVLKNPKLRECAPTTIQDAIINVAAVGLTLNPAHQYAYLVPEYNKNTEQNECVLRISFKGLIKIATDSKAIAWVRADVVHKNDAFLYRGPTEMPIIEVNPFGERGEPVGVYCIAKTHEGDILVETAPWSDVMKARDAAKTKYVWDAWPLEMAKKFIIKRASKQWPRTDPTERLSTAIDVVNKVEGSDFLDYEERAQRIIEALENGDESTVFETWNECDERAQSVLWTAVTKGGWFTQEQKTEIRRITLEWKQREAQGAAMLEADAETLEHQDASA